MNNANTQLRDLVNALEPLLNVCVKQADRHGLDEIKISTSRARELHRELLVAKKLVEAPRRRQQSLDVYLDAVTEFNSAQS